jgi:uncharacterized protein YfbU (UPF0304 family)
MATITLRLDDEVRDQLEALADTRGETLSDVIRSAIDSLLDRDRGTNYGQTPASLTPVERKQLSMLHRILARLLPEDANEEDGDPQYQFDRARALEAGWVTEYAMEFVQIEPELSRQECRLVMDILDMFRFLQDSLARLSEAEVATLGERSKHLTFQGFDENDRRESRLLYYARSLIEQGKWSMHADVFDSRHEHGNSHAPLLGFYLRLLAGFTPIWRGLVKEPGRFSRDEGYLLTPEQLKHVLDRATSRKPG